RHRHTRGTGRAETKEETRCRDPLLTEDTEIQSEHDPLPFRPYAPGTQPPYDTPAYGSTQKRHPQESLVRVPHTITETAGPRFSAAHFPPIPDLSIVDGKTALGERIIVKGRITDEDGRRVPRTIVEI